MILRLTGSISGQHVDIEQAVIDRGYQDIGIFMTDARQDGRAARRVDKNDVTVGEFGEGRIDGSSRRTFIGFGIRSGRLVDTQILGQGDRFDRFGVFAAVIDITRQRRLAGIQIQRADAVAAIECGNGQMQRRRGFAGSTFFIADDNDFLARTRHPGKSDLGLYRHLHLSDFMRSGAMPGGTKTKLPILFRRPAFRQACLV